MTVSHRQEAAASSALTPEKAEKVARMACCCKLSDLLPLVRQRLEATKAGAERRRAEAA